jgi:hypothetical protein
VTSIDVEASSLGELCCYFATTTLCCYFYNALDRSYLGRKQQHSRNHGWKELIRQERYCRGNPHFPLFRHLQHTLYFLPKFLCIPSLCLRGCVQ